MTTEVIKTIRASGGDYTTLSAWEAALPASLVTADEQHTAVCYNDWPSGLNDNVTLSGVTVDATRYVKITVAEGHRHTGVPSSGFFMKRDPGANSVPVVGVGLFYSVLEWIDAWNTRNANNSYAIQGGSANYSTVLNCIGRATYTGEKNAAVDIGVASNVNDSTTWPKTINCLAAGASYAAYANRADASRQRYNLYNCVAGPGHSVGFHSHTTVPGEIHNCVSYGNTVDFESTWAAGSDYNASSDSSASIFPNGVTGISSAEFVDAANNDFHLAAGSALIGAGENLYSTFTTDIDGDARPASGAWDIGFDHYVVSGGTANLTIADASHGHAADSPALTVASALAIADAASAHLADSPALTAAAVLAVADALHALASDPVTLGAAGSADLVIADASHGHGADPVVLAAQSLLALADALHSHAADQVALTAGGTGTDLVIADAAHGHAADAPALTAQAWVEIAAAVHAHLADSVNLNHAETLAILEAIHGHRADVVTLVDNLYVRAPAGPGPRLRYPASQRPAVLGTSRRPTQ